MSDFDKEAERERLREKYEREERKREATEQMSELLLQGATMTNAHCSDCGDPIFRYDGQEFCPTCEKPVDRGDTSTGEGADGSGDDNVEVTSPSDDARVRFGSSDDEPTESDSTRPDATADVTTGESVDGSDSSTAAPSLDPDQSTRVEEGHSGDRPSDDAAATAPTGEAARTDDASARTGELGQGDVSRTVEAARASLARTAARFAHAAEDTDDPAVAREHLAAAREAAAALDELD